MSDQEKNQRWFEFQPLQPGRKLKLSAAGLYIFIAMIAAMIRLSRVDFNVFPFLNFLDFHGTSPNFFVCLAGPLFIIMINKDVRFLEYVKISVGVAIGLLLYEMVQLIMLGRTFDVYDGLASFVGGGCSIVMAVIFFSKMTITIASFDRFQPGVYGNIPC